MRDSDIGAVMKALSKAARDWDLPVTEQLGIETQDPFRVLISCLLSLRTKDAVTAQATHRLLKRAKTPQQLLALSQATIRKLIYPVGFYKTKAKRIHEISQHLIGRFFGKVPNSMEDLLSLPGVGRKSANLVLTVGFNKPGICVDTHVHRISNRLGYIRTKNPLETEMALRKKLPKRYWHKINWILVSMGQVICHPVSPWCSRCPVKKHCARRGVVYSR